MDALEVVFLASATLSLLAGLTLLLVNSRRMINRCCALTIGLSALWLYCIGMAMHAGNHPDVYPQSKLLFWLRMNNAVAAFLPWALFLVKESIIAGGPAHRILQKSLPWALASLLLAGIAFSESFLSSSPVGAYFKRGTGYTTYLLCIGALCVTILYSALKGLRHRKGITRIELKFFAINFSLSTLGVLTLFILSKAFDLFFMRYFGPVIITGALGLTLGIVCYYRVFDARQIVLGFGRRLLLILLLGLCAITVLKITEPVMAPAYGLFLMAAVVGSLALYLDGPIQRWITRDSVVAVAQLRRRLQELAREESDEGKLSHGFQKYLAEWNQTERAAFLVNRGDIIQGETLSLPIDWPGMSTLVEEGWLTPEALDRRRTKPGGKIASDFMAANRFGALLAVPRGSATPSLIICLGLKLSLRPYTYPDIRQLLDIGEFMDNLLSHARVAARLTQVEKREAAAMMSRSLAHDLNNLATPVSTFLLHMESRVQAGTTEAEVLADAKHSLRVMQDYIRESLFFARRLVPDFRPTSSAELVASIAKVTQARASARQVTVIAETDVDRHFLADPTLLQRLLQNLVFNGIDATPAGGTVRLTTTTPTPDRIAFSVADEGRGVPPHLMEKIFEPYFTTKDTGDRIRGLGLGLAVSKKIADLHDGSIQIARTPHGGALFTVILPTRPASVT